MPRALSLFGLGLWLWGCAAPDRPADRVETAPAESAPSASLSSSPLSELPPIEELPVPALTLGPGEFPFLPGEPEGASISIGDTTHGRVVQAKELVESERLKILPRQKERDLRWGTDGLVGMLQFAATRLHAETHTPLWVGNLGRQSGGDIEWSVSHNAGRDADVAFAYKDPKSGQPVDPPDLVPIGKDGLSPDRKLALDPARTWRIVRAMLEYDGDDSSGGSRSPRPTASGPTPTSLQYLFVSEAIKKRLLEHAKASGAPAPLIERAAEILRQPAGAAPHDDHLHVRVYCSALDVAGGCVDFGFVHAYAKTFEAERAKSRQKAIALLGDGRPEARRRALLRLGLLGEAEDAARGLAFLGDHAPEVRVAAAELVAAVGDERNVAAIAHRFSEETDPAALAAQVDAIGRLGGPDAGAFLRDLILGCESAPAPSDDAMSSGGLRSPRPTSWGPTPTMSSPFATGFEVPDEGACEAHLLFAPRPHPDRTLDRRGLLVMAARAARFADRIEPVEPLVRLVDPARPELAAIALDSLSFATNQRLWQERDARPLDKRLLEAQGRYAKLVTAYGKASRDAWLLGGFAQRGFTVRALDRRSGWELVRALADEPHIAYNARRVLAKLLDQPRAVVHYGAGDACRLLYGVLWEHRRELRLDPPTDAQRAACSAARSKEKAALAD